MATKTAENHTSNPWRGLLNPKLSRDSESVYDQLGRKALFFHFKAFDEIRLCERV
jgi:hypothetical protein